MLANNLKDYSRHYLSELRGGDHENAFHSLIEADPAIVPLLIEAFRCDSDPDFRGRLFKVIAEFRLPETIPFFTARLYDEYWKSALDCLLMQPSSETVATLYRARERRFDTPKDKADFQSWLDEAIEQAEDYQRLRATTSSRLAFSPNRTQGSRSGNLGLWGGMPLAFEASGARLKQAARKLTTRLFPARYKAPAL